MSGQGEYRVVVNNDVDPLRKGPIDRWLTWNEPTSVLWMQPVIRPRDQATWEELCIATDYETEQLHWDVGTPENPWITYKEAIHNQCSGKAMTLYMGKDILSEEGDQLIQSLGYSLGKLWRAVEESELQLMLDGVLPGGWCALGQPWALMDCPAEQVPLIPSAHGHSRVTVAVLVSFPPEPFYFPDMAHLHRAIQVWNKASRKRPVGMHAELQDDGLEKGAKKTYEQLMLPRYRHSVAVEEMLKETQ